MSELETMQAPQSETTLPLFVDLDGSLMRADAAQEQLIMALKKPQNIVAVAGALMTGISQTKRFLAETEAFDVTTLPYNESVLAYIREAREAGRPIYLATSADTIIAEQIASHLGLFDGIIASSPGRNLTGEAKLKAIQAQTDNGPFEYIGDSTADYPIWEAAERCGFINAPGAAVKPAQEAGRASLVINDKPSLFRALLKAMRPHQSAKSLLVFVPLLFSHQYGSMDLVLTALLAFLLFSGCASAVYLVNDLMDIEADRVHPRKKKRPLASGTLQPVHGVLAAIVLFSTSIVVSVSVMPLAFTLVLLTYVVATTAYSLVLKHYSTIDVVALTGLYTLRLIGGAAAINVALSPWLLNFSLFFFLSLAYLKRYIELDKAKDGRLKGRNYSSDEIYIIAATGLVNGGLSVLTLSLYLNSEFVRTTYASPNLLWLICPVFLFWIYRSWLWAKRGKIHDDPVVFAIKDRVSLLTAAITGAIVVAAKYVNVQEYLV